MHQLIKDAYQFNSTNNRPQKLRHGYRLGFKYTHCLCGQALRSDEEPVAETMCIACHNDPATLRELFGDDK